MNNLYEFFFELIILMGCQQTKENEEKVDTNIQVAKIKTQNKNEYYFILEEPAFKQGSRWNITFAQKTGNDLNTFIVKWQTCSFLETKYITAKNNQERVKDYLNEYHLRSICKQINEHHAHPLVHFKECVRENGNLYFIYQYFDSENLKTYLSKNYEKLTLNNKLIIAFNIAISIECLHKENIIHEKLKCSNILINKQFDIKLCGLGSLLYLGLEITQKGLNDPKIYESINPSVKNEDNKNNPKKYPSFIKEKNKNIISFGQILIALFSGNLKNIGKMDYYKFTEYYNSFPPNIRDIILECLKIDNETDPKSLFDNTNRIVDIVLLISQLLEVKNPKAKFKNGVFNHLDTIRIEHNKSNFLGKSISNMELDHQNKKDILTYSIRIYFNNKKENSQENFKKEAITLACIEEKELHTKFQQISFLGNIVSDELAEDDDDMICYKPNFHNNWKEYNRQTLMSWAEDYRNYNFSPLIVKNKGSNKFTFLEYNDKDLEFFYHLHDIKTISIKIYEGISLFHNSTFILKSLSPENIIIFKNVKEKLNIDVKILLLNLFFHQKNENCQPIEVEFEEEKKVEDNKEEKNGNDTKEKKYKVEKIFRRYINYEHPKYKNQGNENFIIQPPEYEFLENKYGEAIPLDSLNAIYTFNFGIILFYIVYKDNPFAKVYNFRKSYDEIKYLYDNKNKFLNHEWIKLIRQQQYQIEVPDLTMGENIKYLEEVILNNDHETKFLTSVIQNYRQLKDLKRLIALCLDLIPERRISFDDIINHHFFWSSIFPSLELNKNSNKKKLSAEGKEEFSSIFDYQLRLKETKTKGCFIKDELNDIFALYIHSHNFERKALQWIEFFVELSMIKETPSLKFFFDDLKFSQLKKIGCIENEIIVLIFHDQIEDCMNLKQFSRKAIRDFEEEEEGKKRKREDKQEEQNEKQLNGKKEEENKEITSDYEKAIQIIFDELFYLLDQLKKLREEKIFKVNFKLTLKSENIYVPDSWRDKGKNQHFKYNVSVIFDMEEAIDSQYKSFESDKEKTYGENLIKVINFINSLLEESDEFKLIDPKVQKDDKDKKPSKSKKDEPAYPPLLNVPKYLSSKKIDEYIKNLNGKNKEKYEEYNKIKVAI